MDEKMRAGLLSKAPGKGDIANMLKSLGNLKLRHQLALLIGISIFMMVLVQLFYYFRFYLVTKERNDIYVSNLINQVEENLLSNYNDIKKAALTLSYNEYIQKYLVESKKTGQFELNKIVLDVIKYVGSSNESIADIILIDSQNRMTSLGALNSENNYWIFNELSKKIDIQDKDFIKPSFLSLTKDYYTLFMPIFSTTNTSNPHEKIGFIIILCKSDYFQKVVGKISMSENSLFYILDGEFKVVASSDELLQGKLFEIQALHLNDDSDSKFITLYKKQKSIVQYNQVDEFGWSVISIIPLKEMTWDMQGIRSFGVFIGIIMALMLFIIGLAFSRNITRPIAKIITFLGRIGEENLNKRLELREHNEIGELTSHINIMLEKIEGMTRRIFTNQASLYELEISKKQAELSALQSQINPHFLYNTLECIRSIALSRDIMEIVRISSAMAKIFRYSIKGDEFVKVEEEKNCIMDYLSIMSIRYKGKFDISIEIEDNLLNIKILKMILQPIVENAVYHGLEQKAGKGLLMIKGMFGNSSNIIFEISDNGRGISNDELDRLNDSLNGSSKEDIGKRSVGLKNIDNRIKLSYGTQFGIKIESEENIGTKVVVELPYVSYS